MKFQDQPQVIEDSTLSYGGDCGSGVSSEKECTSSASSGVSYNDSTKLSGSGLTCEDPTKPETSLDSSSLYPSVFEEQSSTSREDLQSAEADTSLEASKSSGPQQSCLRQRNMLLKWLQHLQKKMIHRIQNLYKLSNLGDL